MGYPGGVSKSITSGHQCFKWWCLILHLSNKFVYPNYWLSDWQIDWLIDWLIDWITPCGRVLEKLIVPRPVKKFPTLYRTWRFSAVFTRAQPLLLSWIKLMHLCLFSILLIVIEGNLKVQGCDSSFATCIPNLMEIGYLIHFLEEDTHNAQ